MTSTVHHYSPANSPPVEGELDGRETAHEVEVLELQALQAERDGEGGRSVMLMERALQMRCRLVNRLREKWTNAASEPGSSSDAGSHRMSVSAKPDTVGEADLLQEYHAQCGELYDVAERLVVRCNVIAVEHFKRGAFSEASPLLEYAMQMTEDGAYPLCEVEERRRHLRGVTLNNIGCMERRRGHFSEALQYMKSSMEMTGVESPVAYMNTSAILIQLRLSEEAVRMAERSIELLYQTPEDPSLLAVAHHNLAMALEPVDPLRCLEEYALAYRTACSTLGPECETTRSIQRSWRRYEMTRVTPAMGPFFSPDGRAAASGLRGPIGTVPTKHAATAPRCLPATAPSRTNNSKSGGADSPMDVVELFPHPFLPSASTPSVSKAPRDVTPIYRPAVVPRRPLVPEPPPGVTTSSSRRSRAPHSQPHPQRQEQRQQQRRPYGTEKTTHTSRLSTRTAVAAPRQSSVSRANEPEAAAGSGRVAAAMAPSPPPLVSNKRLRRDATLLSHERTSRHGSHHRAQASVRAACQRKGAPRLCPPRSACHTSWRRAHPTMSMSGRQSRRRLLRYRLPLRNHQGAGRITPQRRAAASTILIPCDHRETSRHCRPPPLQSRLW
ncbi:Flagellar_Member_7 [Leishmania braziliensis MHOM/BR/75/M2904]|uniref:Flagellar_Member_7 n=1 Tax=Leishmania braziliensis MHOM/BR/75/M2904 TaxID=420245 RepID=A0A3P3ZFE1_LEIBR|nr:Flagellar_Member_7 [Leishmania braziliensis MHOM/BR/75/M2904]